MTDRKSEQGQLPSSIKNSIQAVDEELGWDGMVVGGNLRSHSYHRTNVSLYKN
jgi:hypothetical protein